MSTFIRQHQILALWLGVLVVNGSAIAGVLWWAIRGRQFSDQDHARYLALEAGMPGPDSGKESESSGKGGTPCSS